ncbi:MAG: 2Fe-2S iron-sulfur cluster binding domain-containing protein, partial [Proteobacteria bacterium]|nr:2Fe-2S iron-sulfur cluster binding domain-containing protein [Pseudomonadota bacterium]
MVQIFLDGQAYDCGPGENVLDALLRQGVALSFSCKKGVCQSCLMKVDAGEAPATAQEGLRDTLREQGYFLPCVCRPPTALKISRPDDAAAYLPARVLAVEPLAESIRRVFLEPSAAFQYRAGQFVNMRRQDGLARTYSLATVPGQEPFPGVDVKLMPGGRMSTWVFDGLTPGTVLDIQGPNGASYYVPGQPDQPILM